MSKEIRPLQVPFTLEQRQWLNARAKSNAKGERTESFVIRKLVDDAMQEES
jgi:hypothetical protein